MIFRPAKLDGVMVIEPEPIHDERGFFARLWGAQEFAERGLRTAFVHCSISFNKQKATLRGMHYQVAPFGETKLIRCSRGAIHDVLVDLRPGSPTRNQWEAFALDAESRRLLYVPEGIAHGFITLFDDCEVTYEIDQHYKPEAARGVRWNDPAFGIEWPLEPRVIADRDARYPDYQG
jgi:dTDP-4-dehydrorhamnose 3,5-epimerase